MDLSKLCRFFLAKWGKVIQSIKPFLSLINSWMIRKAFWFVSSEYLPYCCSIFSTWILIATDKSHIILGQQNVSVGVMVSMLALWAGGPEIDVRSGTFTGNHYLNGLRHMLLVRGSWHWMLCYPLHICKCILPREMSWL